MATPQDLPGRFGRVIRAIDRVLAATGIESVLGGGWAVWRHGFTARLTRDVDIALAADRIDEFLKVATASGFDVVAIPGRWPHLVHRETGIDVDILPEGGQPGRPSQPAPTLIPSPAAMGAQAGRLSYMSFFPLIELKLAANRPKDQADVIELIKANGDKLESIREYLTKADPSYVALFDRLCGIANEPNP